MKYRVAIKGVVTNSEGKILLLKEAEGWDFPGGGLEYPESPAECLVREVYEELGVNSELLSEQPEYVYTSEYLKNGEKKHQITLFYKLNLESENFRLEPDFYEYKYFLLSEIKNGDLHTKFKGLDLRKLLP